MARMLIATATQSPRTPPKPRFIPLGIGILLLFCAIQPARGADPDASMEPVIRVARANYERIKTLDIFWTEDDQPNEGILSPPSLDRLTKDFPTGRYRYE